MKKFLLTMALALIASVTMAQNEVEFTFTRNGNDVTVNVSSANGVTATLSATSQSNAWNTDGAMASRTDVLCQNTNTSATSEDSPITYILTIEGLNSTVNSVAFTHIAVNSGGNLLKGTSEDTIIEESAYVLGEGENGVGLYRATTDGVENGFINYANKAYLPVSALTSDAQGAAYYSFRFEGTTVVEEVEVENAETIIYDLTGRRIEKITQAGIYIVNGNKILVK